MFEKIKIISMFVISGFFVFIQTFISLVILLYILKLIGAIDKVSYQGIIYFSLIYPIIMVIIGTFTTFFDKNNN